MDGDFTFQVIRNMSGIEAMTWRDAINRELNK